MDIGGTDSQIDRPMTGAAIQMLFRALMTRWPDAVVEIDDARVTRCTLKEAAQRAWPQPFGFFVYENRAARDSWTKYGRTTRNNEKMINVTISPTKTDFVAGDDPQGPTQRIVREIQEMLRNNWCF